MSSLLAACYAAVAVKPVEAEESISALASKPGYRNQGKTGE